MDDRAGAEHLSNEKQRERERERGRGRESEREAERESWRESERAREREMESQRDGEQGDALTTAHYKSTHNSHTRWRARNKQQQKERKQLTIDN